ncbi:Salicylic acid-binding protein [Thalictrum thalictroides]|uniref:Salicylic acid-binding protein n=1 Tax=Thalictrum thalictroides TaxID=46969 RepID=A0A7J6VI91_THATH|nr:Salicylic acid-binding protein [Thalictrum thalictroides]
MSSNNNKHHFVLVHGLGHGAWCWYKVRTLLESLGDQVTALDLAASGVNLKKLDEFDTMLDYSQPLLEFMETVSVDERVILVGHSLGGLSLAYAMEKFAEKVSVAIFLTAFMPDTAHPPSYVLDKYSELNSKEKFLDTKFSIQECAGKIRTTMHFGPEFTASKIYQLSPPEDISLARTLIRVGSMFLEDLSTAAKFSEEGYGSVSRAYIVCQDDKTITEDFQRRMIENNPVKEVKEILGADHAAMMSKPQEVCNLLIDIANKYVQVI